MTAKIEFAFGSLSFAAEGTENWLATQLDKVIEAAPALSQLKAPSHVVDVSTAESGAPVTSPEFTVSLAAHIKAKGGDTIQVKRFLAAADWLRQKGLNPLTTGSVSKALASNHQKKLSNPANCLNQLVSKGYCEKNGEGFFITPDGLKDLGYQ